MNREIYLYGAGGLGTKLKSLLDHSPIVVLGFVDPKKAGQSIDGIPVLNFEELQPNSEIWISVLNNWVSVNEIIDTASRFGCTNVLTPPKVFGELAKLDIELDWYWLTSDQKRVFDFAEEASAFFQDRFDEKSFGILHSILTYRLGGRLDESIILPESQQYLETGIPDFWSGHVSLIDCGAYTGDTLQSIVKRGIKLEYAVAFEPDFINFAKLTDSFKTLGLKGFCIPAAIGDQLRLVGLQAQGTSGANITSLGDAENYCLEVPGGMVINDVPITHIKMDIEGFELNALTGLRDILVKHHPSLAISVYHRPDDLVAIPRFIEDIGGYSKWSLRTFANQTFESILYVSA